MTLAKSVNACEQIGNADDVAAGLGEILYPSSLFTYTEWARIEKLVATLPPEVKSFANFQTV